MFGDGASNIGYFHEALNLSKAWGLPVLWVCENNLYGMGTAVDRASALTEIHQKADAYNIPNKRIEGMDIMEVYEETTKALEFIRAGNGPYLLEIMTYRFRGHSMGDPERYRKQAEVKMWEESDPIAICRAHLIKEHKVEESVLDAIDIKVDAEVIAAVEFAESSPEPTLEDLYKDIYVD